MFSSVRAAYIQGIKSIGVDVQADVSSGLPVDLAKRSGGPLLRYSDAQSEGRLGRWQDSDVFSRVVRDIDA